MSAEADGGRTVVRLTGRAVLFGFDAADVEADVRARPRSWRLTGAAQWMGLGVLVAPVAAVVPPHAPWAIGALAVGGILARRRWRETHTLEGIAGSCPKCGEDFELKSQRLRSPHPLECEACHHVSSLQLTDPLPGGG